MAIVVIYVLTGATWGEPPTKFGAYATQAEADTAKTEFMRWRGNIVKAFSPSKMFFAPIGELSEMRQRWFMKCPWGARALLADYADKDIYAVEDTFDIQEDADVEMSVINAMARTEEVKLLASLLR